MILHRAKHLLDLVQLSRPLSRALVLAKDVDLACGDLVSLDAVLLGEKGKHVFDEVAATAGGKPIGFGIGQS